MQYYWIQEPKTIPNLKLEIYNDFLNRFKNKTNFK